MKLQKKIVIDCLCSNKYYNSLDIWQFCQKPGAIFAYFGGEKTITYGKFYALETTDMLNNLKSYSNKICTEVLFLIFFHLEVWIFINIQFFTFTNGAFSKLADTV